MNNINTQEISRAVVTESKSAKGQTPANAEQDSGKSIPVEQPSKPVKKIEARPNASQVRSERVERAVAKLNDFVQSTQRDLRFSIDDDSGRAIVKVIDRNSQEVIRQIPDETALRMARNLNSFSELQNRAESDAATADLSGGNSLGLINTRI